MKPLLALALAVTVLATDGAAQATTPAARRAAAEARCDALMTTAEASAVSGLAYTKRDAGGQVILKVVVTTCTFDDASARSAIRPLSILTRRATSVEEARKIFQQSKTASYADGQPATGVGEQALWSPSLGQVSALQGRTWIIVTARGNKDLATKIAQALVKKVK